MRWGSEAACIGAEAVELEIDSSGSTLTESEHGWLRGKEFPGDVTTEGGIVDDDEDSIVVYVCDDDNVDVVCSSDADKPGEIIYESNEENEEEEEEDEDEDEDEEDNVSKDGVDAVDVVDVGDVARVGDEARRRGLLIWTKEGSTFDGMDGMDGLDGRDEFDIKDWLWTGGTMMPGAEEGW